VCGLSGPENARAHGLGARAVLGWTDVNWRASRARTIATAIHHNQRAVGRGDDGGRCVMSVVTANVIERREYKYLIDDTTAARRRAANPAVGVIDP
jgi:hypothetical protein